MDAQSSPPPGWYDDGSARHRWWDGLNWTEHFQPLATAAPMVNVVAAPVKYETKSIDYIPGRKIGAGGQRVMDKMLAQGWEVVTVKNRFGAVTTATLRRPKRR